MLFLFVRVERRPPTSLAAPLPPSVPSIFSLEPPSSIRMVDIRERLGGTILLYLNFNLPLQLMHAIVLQCEVTLTQPTNERAEGSINNNALK
ncbi:hypothetical protein OPV22_019839 [Ensete ventricosum]|uniref:Uncharacterized protein n=1 Tax=Ensete ventricosum TaxID=4639 RepID=A0AAV8QD46_ENSVE|nr:hypothetical protein OPV22_019839 [Ensete ventricosum]